MRRFLEKLQFVKIKDICSIFVMLAAIPYGIFLKRRRKHIWLICEDRKEARDNGYWLYKYICEEHSEIDVVYAIDFKSADYEKVAACGREVIPFGTYKHWCYYIAAEKNISSQKDGKPNAAVCYLLEVYGIWKNKRVFLQHGVTHNDVEFLYYKNTKMRLFVCAAKKEYEYIRDTFGYPQGYVQYLGFSRFDRLYDLKIKKNQILVMPTWREWIATPSKKSSELDDMESFCTTEYFREWQKFLEDKQIHKLLNDNGLQLIFYPHRNMQKFLNYFETVQPNIIIADWRKYDVQQLLKESAFLVTDYSSIHMDFAYMYKPMLYYQFDYQKFRKGQYPKGYFDYKADGFGPVCSNIEEVRDVLTHFICQSFQNDQIYRDREQEFFKLHDQENCKRNFEAILEI